MRSDLMQSLSNVREDSKWHRESSVKEHTRMCVSWFMNNIASKRSERDQIMVVLALLFHDTGKPLARTEKFSEERGVYYSYPGHEGISAKIFEDYYLNHINEYPFTYLNVDDVLFLKNLIEFHLPYDFKGDKLSALKTHLMHYPLNNISLFFDVLRSDAHGRISDDPEGTYTRVEEWIDTFYKATRPMPREFKDNTPILFVMIGASGSGKSTYIKNYGQYLQGTHFGLDQQRELFYMEQFAECYHKVDKNYSTIFKYCCDHDKEFNQYVNTKYQNLLKTAKLGNFNILLDNTNTSRKERRKWINQARDKDFKVVGIYFMVKLQTVLDRQSTRPDKCVPEGVVKKQYFSISTPFVETEVDDLMYTVGESLC